MPKIKKAISIQATLGLKNMSMKKKKKMKLLLMISPFMLLVFAFSYVPLFGWIFAFTNYTPGLKFSKLHFVGLKFFAMIFSDGGEFFNALKNTAILSCLAILSTPLPMVLAIMITQLRSNKFKRVIQTITSFPNFISWILIYAIVYMLLSSQDSAFNKLLMNLHLVSQPTNVLGDGEHAWIIQTILGIYKGIGYSAIIYIATIAGINPEYYDAAEVDGAGRLARIWHVTVPHLLPTYIVLLLLAIANFLNNGFEQFYVFKNPLTVDHLEVLDTYTYRVGLELSQFSYSTAVGMFKTVISVLLLMFSNKMAKKLRGESII